MSFQVDVFSYPRRSHFVYKSQISFEIYYNFVFHIFMFRITSLDNTVARSGNRTAMPQRNAKSAVSQLHDGAHLSPQTAAEQITDVAADAAVRRHRFQKPPSEMSKCQPESQNSRWDSGRSSSSGRSSGTTNRAQIAVMLGHGRQMVDRLSRQLQWRRGRVCMWLMARLWASGRGSGLGAEGSRQSCIGGPERLRLFFNRFLPIGRPERVGRVPQSETTGRMSYVRMESEWVATNWMVARVRRSHLAAEWKWDRIGLKSRLKASHWHWLSFGHTLSISGPILQHVLACWSACKITEFF